MRRRADNSVGLTFDLPEMGILVTGTRRTTSCNFEIFTTELPFCCGPEGGRTDGQTDGKTTHSVMRAAVARAA